jgi:hypothetical protein
MIDQKCDLLCGNRATRRVGKLLICESCATQQEDQHGSVVSDARGSDRSKKISHEQHPSDGSALPEGVMPTRIAHRRLYSSEDLAVARRFLSGMRPKTSWDEDEQEFMATAAHRLYRVNFVGRFAQRIDRAIAHYYARVEKANRLAVARHLQRGFEYRP